jgi:sec-independent protein translocase protein TatC
MTQPDLPPYRDPTDPDELEIESSRASLIDHLSDLASSVKWSVATVIGAAGVCFLFFEPLFFLLTEPLYKALGTLELDTAIKFRTVQGAFLFHLKISILAGFILSAPMLFYQTWRFIAPGLYKNERRLIIPFVFTTSLFFFMGVAFCYIAVMPFAFDFFLSYSMEVGGRQLLPDITLEDYLTTFTKIILAFGIVFQTPIFLAFLSWVGMITHRSLIDQWRWATVGSFVIAAFLTPPDYITQTLLALPLMTFYALSIIIAWYITTRRERDEKPVH